MGEGEFFHLDSPSLLSIASLLDSWGLSGPPLRWRFVSVNSQNLRISTDSLFFSGPYWTHVLFTWKSQDGLKVYVNGTLHTTDPNGKVSYSYTDSSSNMLTGSESDQDGRYVNGAFDEFIIWERVLTPKEVEQYFAAAVGKWKCHPFLASCGVEILHGTWKRGDLPWICKPTSNPAFRL